MTRWLIMVSAVGLVLAAAADGAARRGRTEIEFLGGWVTASGADLADHPEAIASGRTGADLDGWFAMGTLNRFFSDNFQIGVGGFGAWIDGSISARSPAVREFQGFDIVYDVDVDATVWGLGGRAKWHFSPQGRLTPYVGAQAFWANANIDVKGTADLAVGEHQTALDPFEESETVRGILWGPLAGLRYNLGGRTDLFVEYQYHLWAGSLGDVLKSGHAISGGLNIRFK